ncbi:MULTISPECIES: acetaldehyde dehydrogenase (acetylating) [Brevibacillus]|uniref:acetaldehyde dehydrogenase (acetylating) n=1 Tax=Brevibacillus TaxID=55080 RepID=UPI000EDAB55C|nr:MULTISPECIES: acetaldehyde dehydrogenase (acetylating) [Brevibacillus]MBU8714264.1 acetaldehyde dehydrogenase (acetylating) [Brevibacillus parabrevis]MED2253354.1 acetaldehyde dehydrogenase (acetylating) [Brevibacillus parabrevis]WDV94233.1 acetaldehyde dehydrogenase (acetylating) [Brevibacillus parabrevis]HBZ81978.1 acetaldehyde dehydrogenase (acetylating) [Brevibacillus sp.]
MMLDADLQSVQEVRQCLQTAKEAQKRLAGMSQAQIDQIVQSMAEAARQEAGRLAAMAVEETGYGKAADKTAKNLFAAQDVHQSIQNMKTVGIINRDEQNRVWEVAQAVGVIAGIVPSTNPTSTVIFKALISVKAGNAIVFSPHPQAAKCTKEAARVVQAAAERAGAPAGLIACITQPTLAAYRELMHHSLTDLILATGGTAMVKAAYSSGKPAYGVGPGNVPVYVHASADIPTAIRQVVQSKTFDYGTICASEQSLVVDQSIKRKVVAELKRQGAYFLDDHETRRVAAVILAGKSLNPAIVGKSPQALAELAGILVPEDATLLVAEETGVGLDYPFSVEKLAPILALYTVADTREASTLCSKLLAFGGLGHTLGIHCRDQQVIESFVVDKPASRIVVNSGTTFGGIGATTGIAPSLTLGCGSLGNNVTSDNIGPQHLFNIKRVAFGLRDMQLAQTEAAIPVAVAAAAAPAISRDEIAEIIKSVLLELQSSGR